MFGKGKSKDRSTSPSPTSSLLLFNQLRKERQEQCSKESIQAQEGIATPKRNSEEIAQSGQKNETANNQITITKANAQVNQMRFLPVTKQESGAFYQT